VRQIKPAQLAFRRTINIILLTYLLKAATESPVTDGRVTASRVYNKLTNSARRFTAGLVNRSNAATASLYDMNDFRRLAHTEPIQCSTL